MKWFNILKRNSKSSKEIETKGTQVGRLPADDIFMISERLWKLQKDEIDKPYEESQWVYAGVRVIAENISQVPFNFYRDTQEGRVQVISEWDNLFYVPNPLMSGRELWEATIIYMLIDGECFWLFDRENPNAIPARIWVLSGNQFKERLDKKTNALIGWEYATGTQQKYLELDDVLHFKFFNPYNLYRGLSPLKATKLSIDQDYYASFYNKNFFKEGATLSGYIEVEKTLNDNQYNRLLNQFEARHKGYTKAHRMGILEGGAKFHSTNLSQKDMDFERQKAVARQEVLSALGLSDVILGLHQDVKSYEGTKIIMRTFWQENLIPKMKLLEEVTYRDLFSKINNGELYGAFDISRVEALQEDYSVKLEKAKSLFSLGYPINSINAKLDLGMDDIEGGDISYLPIGLIPMGTIAEVSTGTPTKILHLKDIKAFPKNRLIQNYNEVQTGLEKQFQNKLRRFFFEQRKRMLSKLQDVMKSKDLSDMIFDEDFELSELIKLLKPIYQLSIKQGAELIAEETGLSGFIFQPLDPVYLGAMELRLQNIPDKIIHTIQGRLRTILLDGISSGATLHEMAEKIRSEYNWIATSRALTIARTETGASISAGRHAQLKKQGIEKHQWITAQDEEVRDTHRLLNNSIAIIDHPFPYANGSLSELRYPGDMQASPAEIINCRCITLAVEE